MTVLRFILAGVLRIFISVAVVTTGVSLAVHVLENEDLAAEIAGNIERSLMKGMATEAAPRTDVTDLTSKGTTSALTTPSPNIVLAAQTVPGFVDAQSVLAALVSMQTQTQRMQQESQDRLLSQLTFELNRSHTLEGTLQLRKIRDEQLAGDLERLGHNLAKAAVPSAPVTSGMAAVLSELKLSLSERGISVETDINAGILRLGENSLGFARGRSDISAPARDVLLQITATLSAVLPKYSPCRLGAGAGICGRHTGPAIETLFIEGHTDQTGSLERNWILSTERAINTYRVMTEAAPDLGALLNTKGRPVLSVAAYAGTRPIDLSPSDEGRARNRRIELRFVMEPPRSSSTREAELALDDFLSALELYSEPVSYTPQARPLMEQNQPTTGF